MEEEIIFSNLPPFLKAFLYINFWGFFGLIAKKLEENGGKTT